MKKTYLWRIALTSVSILVLLSVFISKCNFNINRCLGGDSIYVARTIFHIFLAILIISLVLFFVTDKIFLKWIRFTVVWIILSIILIAITPTYPGGWMPIMAPDKESVSISMGSLLVILSLGQIVWQSWKARK